MIYIYIYIHINIPTPSPAGIHELSKRGHDAIRTRMRMLYEGRPVRPKFDVSCLVLSRLLSLVSRLSSLVSCPLSVCIHQFPYLPIIMD